MVLAKFAAAAARSRAARPDLSAAELGTITAPALIVASDDDIGLCTTLFAEFLTADPAPIMPVLRAA